VAQRAAKQQAANNNVSHQPANKQFPLLLCRQTGRRADGQTGRRADRAGAPGCWLVRPAGRLAGCWLGRSAWLAAGSAAQPGWLLASWCLVSVARWLGLGGWLAVWLRVYGCGRWLPRSSGYDKKHGRRSVICVDVPIRGGGKYS